MRLLFTAVALGLLGRFIPRRCLAATPTKETQAKRLVHLPRC